MKNHVGLFYVWSEKKGFLGVLKNTLVDSGTMLMLSHAFNGIEWPANGNRYMAIGLSSRSGGVNGPEEQGDPWSRPTSGAWQGVDPMDYKLGNEITSVRPQTSVLMSGKVAFLKATFTSTSTLETTQQRICEIGVFAGLDVPSVNPVTNPEVSQAKQNAMLVRSISYLTIGENYVSDPILWNPTTDGDLHIVYVVADFDR